MNVLIVEGAAVITALTMQVVVSEVLFRRWVRRNEPRP